MRKILWPHFWCMAWSGALLAGASFAVQAQSGVTVFGNVSLGVQIRSRAAAGGGPRQELLNGGFRPSVFGFRGSEDLGGGTEAFFNLEGQFGADSGTLLNSPGTTQAFRRQANLGLRGAWGGLTLGRVYAPALIGTLPVEPRAFKEQFSNLYLWAHNQLSTPGNVLGAGASTGNDVGVFLSNAVQYNIRSGPYYVGLAYAPGEGAAGSAGGRTLSLGATYAGPVTLGLGYQHVRDAVSAVPVSRLSSVGMAVPIGTVTGRVHRVNVDNNNPTTGGQVSRVQGTGVGLDVPWRASDTATLAAYHNRYQGAGSGGTTRALVLSNDHALSRRTTLFVQLAWVEAPAVGAADTLEGLKGTIVSGGTAAGTRTTLLGVGMSHRF